MNYRDYMAIMEAERLTLPEIGKHEIEGAKHCQRIIRKLKAETAFDTTAQIKQMEERKIGHILRAIDWAQINKLMPIETAWADKQLRMMLDRDRKKENAKQLQQMR